VKNILTASVVVLSLMSVSDAEEFSPKQVFDNGFASALEVIEYSNDLREKGEFVSSGKYCMKLNFSTAKRGEVFKIFKLFSLSLKLGMQPFYLSPKEGDSGRIFCLGVVDDYEEGMQEIKEARKRYSKIDSYNPRVISLGSDAYVPTFPFLREDNYPSIPRVVVDNQTIDNTNSDEKVGIQRNMMARKATSLPENVSRSSLSQRVYILKDSKNIKEQ